MRRIRNIRESTSGLTFPSGGKSTSNCILEKLRHIAGTGMNITSSTDSKSMRSGWNDTTEQENNMTTQNQQTLATIRRLHSVWDCIKYRTHTDKGPYANKNLKLCRAWDRCFYAFLTWSLKNGYEFGLEIDRIKNDKGYSPTNCRYVSHRRNLENRGSQPFSGKKKINGVSLPMCIHENYGRPGHKIKKRYKCLFSRGGVRYYLGEFLTVEKAVAARDKAIKRVERILYGTQQKTLGR